MEAHSTQGTESIGMDFRPRLCYCTERAALLRAPSQHFDKEIRGEQAKPSRTH